MSMREIQPGLGIMGFLQIDVPKTNACSLPRCHQGELEHAGRSRLGRMFSTRCNTVVLTLSTTRWTMATSPEPSPERKRRGRPPILREKTATEDICRKVTRYLKLGCTHETIAGLLDISIDTFYEWIKKYPDFSEAVKAGEVDADANVASAMYRAATGNKRTTEIATKVKDSDGSESVTVTEVEVSDPLNVAAQIFWLKNRQRRLWRDVRANEMSGPDGGPIEIDTKHVISGRQLEPGERDKLRALLESGITDVVDQSEENDDDNDDNGSEPR